MINKISCTTTQKTNNKSDSKQITFGIMGGHAKETITYITDMADYSQKIHELKKQRLFYKIFPFFNFKPSIEKVGNLTRMVGEEEIGWADKHAAGLTLKEQYLRLLAKTNKKKN